MESKLFQSLRVGRVKLDHRVVMAPLTRLRADNEHVQLPIAVEYYSQRASIPGTLIVTEATLISPAHGGFGNAPGMWSDTQIAGWKNVTDAVHARKCSIFCQLVAPGRAATVEPYPLLSSSATPMTEDSEVPQAMTHDQIISCIADFKQAAKNAILAGFDGVEIHGANGYLVDQFIQDTCNTRTDSWGGSDANRARFALEIAAALVDAVGADRVGFRISPFSLFQGMKMEDPIPQFTYLVEQLKLQRLSYLHIIESRVNNNVDVEGGESINFLLDAWGNTSPVFLAGGYTPENVIPAVDEKYKNFNVAVVFGRHFLANPDLPYRIKHKLPLNKYDRSTFYTHAPAGYIDYPFNSTFVECMAL